MQLRDTATVELFYLCAKQSVFKVRLGDTQVYNKIIK